VKIPKTKIRATLDCLAILAALAGLMGPPVMAAGAPENGLKLARQWCAACHEVESKTVSSDAAPPFAEIAQRRDTNWMKSWLSDPHPPMKGISLSRSQIDDLTAYIQSFAPPERK